MATQCKMCEYPGIVDLEKKILSKKVTYVDAAKLIGCHPSSITRHMRNHLTRRKYELVSPQKERNIVTAAESLLDLMENAKKVLEDSVRKKDPDLTLKAIRELRGIIETATKFSILEKKNEELVIRVEYV